MKNKQLFLMMGAPGAGKSTWLKRQLKDNDVYVSRDIVRFSKLQPGDDYFKYEGEVFAEFTSYIVNALSDKNVDRVFADASHLNAGSRFKILNAIAKEFERREKVVPYDVNVIWLKTSLETCIERNNYREGRANVPEGTITSMWKSQTLPKASEGVKRVYVVSEKQEEILVISYEQDENDFKF